MNITEDQIELFNFDERQTDFINHLIYMAYIKGVNEGMDKIIALRNNQ